MAGKTDWPPLSGFPGRKTSVYPNTKGNSLRSRQPAGDPGAKIHAGRQIAFPCAIVITMENSLSLMKGAATGSGILISIING